MIAHLRGSLSEVTENMVVVDVGGIGFGVVVPASTRGRLPERDREVLLHTYLAIRQDGVSLYGFSTPSELVLFQHLTSVSGVGPKLALSVLSSYSPDGFYAAVLNEDVVALTRVPGIGAKIAQRIILELRDRIGIARPRRVRGKGITPIPGEGPVAQAVEALLALGYGRMEAASAVEAALAELGSAQNVEEIIRQALKSLARV